MGDDPEAVDLLDRALQNPPSAHIAFDNVQGTAPTGTSADAALRRLRKDRPDLHARVLARELSPHAAMVEAGFRPRTITAPVDDMAKLADALKRHLTPEQIATLQGLKIARPQPMPHILQRVANSSTQRGHVDERKKRQSDRSPGLSYTPTEWRSGTCVASTPASH